MSLVDDKPGEAARWDCHEGTMQSSFPLEN